MTPYLAELAKQIEAIRRLVELLPDCSALLAETRKANTGDETTATIKAKLGITVLSGDNTGDQTLASLGAAAVAGSAAQDFAVEDLSFVSIVGGIGKVGSLTRSSGAASGNVAYTGIGFKPSAILFLCAIDTVSEACWGLGTADGGRSLYSDASNNKASSALAIHFIRSTDTQDATIASMDADGFTLSWTRTGGGATGNSIVVNYIAFR